MTGIHIPQRGKGRPSEAKARQYEEEKALFAASLLKIDSTLDFTVSSRGWCYILEEHGLSKGDFDVAQKLINDCRKSGLLPIDFCAEDASRVVKYKEAIDGDVEDECIAWTDTIKDAYSLYTPFSKWDYQDVYLELFVEKIDLVNLFEKVCRKWDIVTTNIKGWSDLNRRYQALQRFAEHTDKQCVLLYCGDHDPAGLNISNTLHNNLETMIGTRDRRGSRIYFFDIEIDRFGLNYDFIEEHNLSWVNNLNTSSGMSLDSPRHPDHNKPYVQNYLAEYGVRKVEANALVTRAEASHELITTAVENYLSLEGLEQYWEDTTEQRSQLQEQLPGYVKNAM
jgi:hypothetical protein